MTLFNINVVADTMQSMPQFSSVEETVARMSFSHFALTAVWLLTPLIILYFFSLFIFIDMLAYISPVAHVDKQFINNISAYLLFC